MLCPKCGSAIPDGGMVCEECGYVNRRGNSASADKTVNVDNSNSQNETVFETVDQTKSYAESENVNSNPNDIPDEPLTYEKGTCQKICEAGEKADVILFKVMGVVGGIIVLLLVISFIKMPSNERNNMVYNTVKNIEQELAPDYVTAIKNSTLPALNENETIGEMFSRCYTNGKWTTDMGSTPRVTFSGMSNNGNGTYSKVEVVFAITPTDKSDEFYFNVENIFIDGMRVTDIFNYWNYLYNY